MDQTPNSQIDILSQDINKIKIAQSKINSRLETMDQTILRLLKVLQTGEAAFEVRVSRILSNTFKGLTHDLDHAIDSTAQSLARLERGFDIFPVDGKEVKENEKTIQVTRRDDGGYDYALANDPDLILNENTEAFSNFFNQNPTVFGDRKELLVNIIAYATKRPEESENGKA